VVKWLNNHLSLTAPESGYNICICRPITVDNPNTDKREEKV